MIEIILLYTFEIVLLHTLEMKKKLA